MEMTDNEYNRTIGKTWEDDFQSGIKAENERCAQLMEKFAAICNANGGTTGIVWIGAAQEIRRSH